MIFLMEHTLVNFFVFGRMDPIIGAYFVGLRLATGY